MKRFSYFYLMNKETEKIMDTVPSHVAYWKAQELEHYQGGPFSDRSGGLITFATDNIENATKIILNDPFIIDCVIAEKWIKEWIPE